MGSGITGGYLVLADISGFTSFVAGSELEHARSILDGILKLIVANFSPSLRIAEIEGDAVFAFVPGDDLPRGELLLEIIEATYRDFRTRQLSEDRMSRCACRACEQSSLLDLKFITHYGEFALQKVTGRIKPFGSSVNLLHRLSKNGVTSETGWRGYVLFTEETLTRMRVHPPNLHQLAEQYEHLGTVQTFSLNLGERFREMMHEKSEIVKQEQADVIITREFPVPTSVLWDWLNDPEKRQEWMIFSDWQVKERPSGRTMRGATNHCTKSGFVERVRDWRPFSYYTVEIERGLIRIVVTWFLTPVEGGTRLAYHVRLPVLLPRMLKRPLCRMMITRGARTQECLDLLSAKLNRLVPEAGAPVHA